MSITIQNCGALEGRIDKAISQMKNNNLKKVTRAEFAEDAIGYYLDALKQNKIIN